MAVADIVYDGNNAVVITVYILHDQGYDPKCGSGNEGVGLG